MSVHTELEAMRRAITPTARGLGRPSPSPVVGLAVPDAGISGLEWVLRLEVSDVTEIRITGASRSPRQAVPPATATATQEA